MWGYPEADVHVTPARERLSAAARLLLDAIMTADDADDVTLDAAAAQLESVATDLRGGWLGHPVHRVRGERLHRDYLPRSPLVGSVSPLSPLGSWTFDAGVLDLRVTFGAAYEGPPGHLHGGFVALAFDELLAMVTVLTGESGLTGKLSVRYRKPTPLYQELRLNAWIDHREGRRIVAKGTIRADDNVTAEAEGLFVKIRDEHAVKYFT